MGEQRVVQRVGGWNSSGFPSQIWVSDVTERYGKFFFPSLSSLFSEESDDLELGNMFLVSETLSLLFSEESDDLEHGDLVLVSDDFVTFSATENRHWCKTGRNETIRLGLNLIFRLPSQISMKMGCS